MLHGVIGPLGMKSGIPAAPWNCEVSVIGAACSPSFASLVVSESVQSCRR